MVPKAKLVKNLVAVYMRILSFNFSYTTLDRAVVRLACRWAVPMVICSFESQLSQMTIGTQLRSCGPSGLPDTEEGLWL